MFDAPFANTVIDAFKAEIAPTLRHSVGGIPCEADITRAIAKVCKAHEDVTPDELRRWLEEGRVI